MYVIMIIIIIYHVISYHIISCHIIYMIIMGYIYYFEKMRLSNNVCFFCLCMGYIIGIWLTGMSRWDPDIPRYRAHIFDIPGVSKPRN
jgi:hypothetical protein